MPTTPKLRPALLAAAGFLALAPACAVDPHAAETLPDPASSPTTFRIAPLGFEQGMYHPINDVSISQDEYVEATINGNVAISFAGGGISGSVDASDALEESQSNLGLSAAATLEFDITGATELDFDIPLPPVVLASINFGGGVTATPYIYAKLHGEGSATGATRTSVVLPLTTEMGIDREPGSTSKSVESGFLEPSFGPPDTAGAVDTDLSLTFEGGIAFMVQIQGIPVGGPFVGAAAGASLGIAPLSDPWWTFDAVTNFTGGWTFLTPESDKTPTSGPILPKTWALTAASGSLPIEPSSARWSRRYDCEQTEELLAATATGRELRDFSVVGDECDALDGPWVADFGAAGTTTLERGLGGTASFEATSLVTASDGELILAGNQLKVVKLDEATPLWALDFDLAGAGAATWVDAVARPGGGVLLGGNATYDDAKPHRLLFAELDADGNPMWASEVYLGAEVDDARLVALEFKAGQIIAVGDADYQNAPDQIDATLALSNGFVLRLDSDGAATDLALFGSSAGQTVHAMAKYPGGDVIVGGQSGSSMWLSRINGDDTLQWSALYGGDESDDPSAATGIVSLTRGRVAVSGFEGNGTARDGVLMSLDRNGMPVWFKSYRQVGSGQTEELNGLVRLNNGLAAFGSSHTAATESDLWIARTSVDGMLHFDDDADLDAHNDHATWERRSDFVVDTLTPTSTAVDLTSEVLDVSGDPAALTEELLTQ